MKNKLFTIKKNNTYEAAVNENCESRGEAS